MAQLTDLGDYAEALLAEVDRTRELVLAAAGAELARESPCPGWSVLDVARHVEVTPRALADGLESHLRSRDPAPPAPLPLTAGAQQILGSLATGSESLARIFDELSSSDLDGELPGPVGPMPGRQVLDLALTEMALHRCDIEIGLGASPALKPAVAETLINVIQAWLLLLAPAHPRPSEPCCYRFSDGTTRWSFRFDGHGWDSSDCPASSSAVTSQGDPGTIALGLAGRLPIEQVAAETFDATSLRMLKTYLPGP